MSSVIVVLISAVFLIILIIKELRRKNKARLALRLLTSSIAVIALACLVLPVRSPFTISREAKTAVIITSGATADSISGYKKYPLFYLDKDAQQFSTLKGNMIADIAHFLETSDFTNFHIIGYGATAEDLALFNGKQVSFHPAALPAGVISISWNNTLRKGEPLVISGRYNNPLSGPVKLFLNAQSTELDSVIVPSGDAGAFTFRNMPKQLGRNSYQLIARRQGTKNAISDEKIPFEVLPSGKLQVLLLADAPGFENKFLKNWLSEKGFSVVSRSAISRGKYSTGFLNSAKTDLQQLTAGRFSKFDLVVANRATLNTLAKTEVAALTTAISAGTGLLIAIDSLEKQSAAVPGSFSVYTLSTQAERWVSIRLEDETFQIAATHPVFIADEPGSQVVVRDEKHRILVAAKLYGRGVISSSSLPETYPLQLSGNYGAYSSLWSAIIKKTARKGESTVEWRVDKPFLQVGEHQRIILRTTATPPKKTTIANQFLPPAQDALKPYEWRYDYRPESVGWQNLEQQGGPGFSWYVYDTGSWRALHAAERLEQTKRFIAHSKNTTLSTDQAVEQVKSPVSKAWFLLLLIICCVFLWAEPKFL